jgi:hypothetical protein
MISLKQESIIREQIGKPNPLPNRVIADMAGVSHPQVIEIKRVRDLYEGLPASVREEIATKLKEGFPASALPEILGVPKKAVNAVRRWRYLHHRAPGDGGPTLCPCCYHVLYGDELYYEAPLPVRPGLSPLEQIAWDLVDLEKLHIVRQPLFYYLAQRAKKVLEDAEKEKDES